jgi:predicted HTH transcriptional regulator
VPLITEIVPVEVEGATRRVLVAHIAEGTAKPYKDKNGVIWIKQGPDKRRLTDNHEIARFFASSGLLYLDEMPVPGSSMNDINKDKVQEYLDAIEGNSEVPTPEITETLLANLGILKHGQASLAGLLFFAKKPQLFRPAFCIKAVSFFGNSIGGVDYRDSLDITGTIPRLFEEGMAFFNRNLMHLQKGQNFNSVGILEISEIALQELLLNALMHRDYSKNAPIRLMVFDNRIEIVSPGSLPNHLSVESIKMGNAVMRNNLIASYAAKLLPYRGFGSGIIRALQREPGLELVNDAPGEQFTARIGRNIE